MLERLARPTARLPDNHHREPRPFATSWCELAGHDMLKAKGLALIAASAPTHFTEDTPTAVLVRQVLGAVAEFDKTTLVAKLAAARQRKRIATGQKVEGRKSHAEDRPEVTSPMVKAAAAQEAEGRANVAARHRGRARGARLSQRAWPAIPLAEHCGHAGEERAP